MAIKAVLDNPRGQLNIQGVNYPGPRPGIEFSFFLRQQEDDLKPTLLHYLIRVYFRATYNSQEIYIGKGELSDLGPFQSMLDPARWRIIVPVDVQTLGVIEQTRRYSEDGAVTFTFQWEVCVNEGGGQPHFYWVELDRTSSHVHVKVDRETWINVLKQLGWGYQQAVEVHFPEEELQSWQGAFKHIQAAEGAFHRRIDNNVLQECENALEEISGVSGPRFLDERLIPMIKKLVDDDNKAELVVNLTRCIVNLTRRGKHLTGQPETPAFDADGRDAEFALTCTKGLLVYLSKLGGSRR